VALAESRAVEPEPGIFVPVPQS